METNYIPVKDHNNILRDAHSKAIVYTDRTAINRYEEQRNLIKRNMDTKEEIENIKKDISDIKEFLLKLIKEK